MSTEVTTPTAAPAPAVNKRGGNYVSRAGQPRGVGRVLAYATLIGATIGILLPFLYSLYTSFRPYAETAQKGYFSLPDELTLVNYTNAWAQSGLLRYFLNTMIIAIPAIVIILALATFLGYALSRFSFRFNLVLLMLFTAGNLLPQQVIITPLFRIYRVLPLPGTDSGVWYDSFFGLIMINVAFQLGFCTFVMSNYMKTVPSELTEAALVDGAGVWRQFWQVILPLCRAPLAALATLEFTWIYNDFFWALVLMPTGDKKPITSALNNLKGQYFTDFNLLAAGSVIVMIPTIVVYLVLQKQFVGGLTLGANKG